MATTTALDTDVRRLGQVPENITTASILLAADLEISSVIFPFLRRMNSNFGVREVSLTPAGGRCPLPRRAIGASIRNVQYQVGTTWVNLPQLALEQDEGPASNSGYPFGFYIDSGALVLVPRGTSATLRVRYWPQPGALVATSVCKQITSVTTSGSNTTLVTGAALSPAPTYIDVISSASHHSEMLMAYAASYSSGYVVATASLPWETPVVGDWVCTAEQTCIVPCPDELYPALCYLVASNLMLSLGYAKEAKGMSDEGQRRMALAADTFAPRIQGNPQKVSGGIARTLGRNSTWWRW